MAGGNNSGKGGKGGSGGGNANQPFTPYEVNAAQGLTNAQTQGPLTELAKQIALNNKQGNRTMKLAHGYFNQLGQYSRQGLTSERNIANQTNSQLAALQNQTQQQMGQYGQQAAQTPGLEGLAANGMGGGLAGVAGELARQKGLAAQNAGTFRAAGIEQGGNYRGLAASNQQSYALGGQERLGQIAQATRLAAEPLNAKIAGIRATEGALLAKYEAQLHQQDIANQFTAKGLNLKGQALKNALTLGFANINAAGARQAAAIAAGKSGSGGKSGGSSGGGSSSGGSSNKMSPAAQQEFNVDVTEAKSTIQVLRQKGFSDAEIRQVLTQGYKGFKAADGGGYGSAANIAFRQLGPAGANPGPGLGIVLH